ncbi:hypothetical protein QP568_09610 [Propionimicrobium lymphophilum]|uniref:hypothetical protein n=1 Tax=Propionimicrobium lymphophilum TaxID=33012 RepID=UPI00254FDA91|nr:hypothetical protein [Propionimicrobium lymphophilum]MDK7710607.1 hypothetical protein [Propionimicrobium lymphophilum]MDK7734538.1 hypothetical protein [Propionimicrobium lymphophilum]
MKKHKIAQYCKINTENVTPVRQSAEVAINLVSTNKDSKFQNYCLMIDSEQLCCESWIANNNCQLKEGFVSYIYTDVKSEELSDFGLETPEEIVCDYRDGKGVSCGCCELVVFTVNRKNYLAYVMNHHNGYYSHLIWQSKTSGEDAWRVDVLLESAL